jgi:hypothetical protein
MGAEQVEDRHALDADHSPEGEDRRTHRDQATEGEHARVADRLGQGPLQSDGRDPRVGHEPTEAPDDPQGADDAVDDGLAVGGEGSTHGREAYQGVVRSLP